MDFKKYFLMDNAICDVREIKHGVEVHAYVKLDISELMGNVE